MSGCSHGKTFKEPCTECQLVLAREGLAWALQSVEKYSKLIADLAPDASGPWIERGTGWAKIHNLPPTHLLNEPQAVPTLIELAIEREEKYLHDLIDDEAVGSVMHGDIEGAFHRLNEALALSRPEHSKPKGE